MTGPRHVRRGWRTTAVAALVALVVFSWTGVAAAALLFELTTRQWVVAVAAAAVVTEVALYVGAVVLGIAVLQRVRSRLRLRRSS
jgi:hypothetical protein